jgi:hypothetical protein
LVSTDVASIPDSLRKINIFWLEASTSTKRAPSTWNSFYRNLNDRLLDVMWQQKLLKEMVDFFFFFFFDKQREISLKAILMKFLLIKSKHR